MYKNNNQYEPGKLFRFSILHEKEYNFNVQWLPNEHSFQTFFNVQVICSKPVLVKREIENRDS